jgi:putative ATPase
VLEEATERRKLHGRRTTLFIDEVHRWNKAQQDALLPHVENGMITLIGATTENPYFDVIKALVSRSRVFELLPLTEKEIAEILERALTDVERGYGGRSIALDGDARQPRWKAPRPTGRAWCISPWTWPRSRSRRER